MKIIGISGSLRRASYNTALLQAAASRLPEGVSLELAQIDDIPLYNSDLEEPESVARLKAQIEGADAVLIATPEYNYGVPGGLKNAIDWASRPGYQSVFRDTVVGIIGAAGSVVGTARAQGQLKQVLLGMVANVFPWPEFLVSRAFEKFEEGALKDATTEKFLAEFLTGFVSYIEKQSS